MATGPTNENMADGLKKILSQVASLMVVPDADSKFLQSLQQVIVGFLQQKAHATMGAGGGPGGPGGGPGGPPPGMGGPPGMGMRPPGGPPSPLGNLPPAPPNQMGPGGGGGPTGLAPSMPNLDELNRVLGSGGGVK